MKILAFYKDIIIPLTLKDSNLQILMYTLENRKQKQPHAQNLEVLVRGLKMVLPSIKNISICKDIIIPLTLKDLKASCKPWKKEKRNNLMFKILKP